LIQDENLEKNMNRCGINRRYKKYEKGRIDKLNRKLVKTRGYNMKNQKKRTENEKIDKEDIK
jgi:hypothetical protein